MFNSFQISALKMMVIMRSMVMMMIATMMMTLMKRKWMQVGKKMRSGKATNVPEIVMKKVSTYKGIWYFV